MYLEEIVLDGFKSYAKKVVISQFDQQFNAITGLNGTGKSNILDSICFVLGLKNIDKLRAKNLNELVYKQGQAGVSKATVSLKFVLNQAEEKNLLREFVSNLGDSFTITRQYQVGGKDTYYVNGKTVQQKNIVALCKACNMNVNNPHFLIMQGQVAKVMNNKPMDFVSIIGESAGINTWDISRIKAEKQLEEKNLKEVKIDKILSEEIAPELHKLEKQQQLYHQHQDDQKFLVELQNLRQAQRYIQYKRQYEEFTGLKELRQQELGEIQKQVQQLESTYKDQCDHRTSLTSRLQSIQLLERETSVNSVQGSSTQAQVELENAQNQLKDEQDSLQALQFELQDLDQNKLAKKLEDSKKQLGEVLSRRENVKERLGEVQNELSGKNSKQKTLERLRQQYNEQESIYVQLDSKSQQNTQNYNQLQMDIEKAQSNMSQVSQESNNYARTLDGIQNKIGECEQRRQQLQGRSLDSLQQDKKKTEDQLRSLNAGIDSLQHSFYQLQFSYQDPYKGFDRSRVYGLAAKLFTIQDPQSTLALEIAAGGSLYNIVVESVKEAKALLQGGQLKRRSTFIPLDKIKAYTLSKQKQNLIEEKSRAMGVLACPAIDLIQTDQKFVPAMQYLFGSTVICENDSIAKEIAYGRDTRCRCVTIQGDDFNPSGTLTGGSRNKQAQVLSQIQHLKVQESQVQVLQQSINKTLEQMQQLQQVNQELSILEHQRQLLNQQQGSQTSGQGLQKQLHGYEDYKIELEQAQKDVRSKMQKAKELGKELQQRISNMDKDKGQLGNLIQEDLKLFQDELKDLETATLKLEKDAHQYEAQLSINESSVREKEREIKEQQGVVDLKRQQIEKLTHSSGVLMQRLEAAKKKMEQEDDSRSLIKTELQEVTRSIQDNEQERRKKQLQNRKKEYEFEEAKDSLAATVQGLKELDKREPWIQQIQDQIGVQGSKYDFTKYGDIEGSIKQLHEKVSSQCFKGDLDDQLDKQQKRVQDLQQKRRIVVNDKQTISRSIGIIEEHKQKDFQEAYDNVNREFSVIFSILLRDSSASLEPLEAGKPQEGVLPQVSFNGVKKGLQELSGGQRSLLALAFILSMLKTNPAPIYILDEVDAALDLSHTQNIGVMIQQRFPDSQFLIVSLKEQLFSNANVIFKTQFLDGISSVIRKQNRQQQKVRQYIQQN